MQIITGEATEALRLLPSGCCSTCVTSPPYYGLRNYGEAGQMGLEETPEEYTWRLVEVFREVRRVLKDDGTLWLNIGDSYAASGKGRNRDGRFNEKAENIQSSGQRKSRIRRTCEGNGLKRKDLIGIPWLLAFALRADGWYLRSDIIWQKPNAMPESVKDRPTRAHEYIFLLSKSEHYFYDAEAIKEPAIQVAIKNYPDIIQMGDAFDLHSDDWKLKEAAIRPDISAETKEPQKETPAKKDRSATKTPAFIAAAQLRQLAKERRALADIHPESEIFTNDVTAIEYAVKVLEAMAI